MGMAVERSARTLPPRLGKQLADAYGRETFGVLGRQVHLHDHRIVERLWKPVRGLDLQLAVLAEVRFRLLQGKIKRGHLAFMDHFPDVLRQGLAELLARRPQLTIAPLA